MTRKHEIEGTLSAIFFCKKSRYNCCFVSLLQFIYMTFQMNSVKRFFWNQSNPKLEVKRRLNFDDLL